MISYKDFNKIKEENIGLIIKQKKLRDSKALFESVQNIEKGQYDVFISYSSKDKNNAIFIKSFLEWYGYDVYIDLEDDVLNPTNVNEATAKRLEEKIKKSKSILYVHSQNSEYSVWCPWELGFGEGNNKKISILEIYTDISEYKQKYINLYPIFEMQKKNNGIYSFYAFTRKEPKKWIHFRDFIDGKNAWKEFK